jgi:hypothetical protein
MIYGLRECVDLVALRLGAQSTSGRCRKEMTSLLVFIPREIHSNQLVVQCVDSRGKTVATWSQEETTLHVGVQAEQILDRMVVTCVLNLWVRQLGLW